MVKTVNTQPRVFTCFTVFT